MLIGLWTRPCGVRSVNMVEKSAASGLDQTLVEAHDWTMWEHCSCIRS